MQRSSASSPSTSPQIQQQKLEDVAVTNSECLASHNENLTLPVPTCSPALPLSEGDELQKMLIPTVNIVPSTPIQSSPAASVLPSTEQDVMTERKNDILQHVKVGVKGIDHIQGYCELKDNHSEHEHNSPSSSQPIKSETFKQALRQSDNLGEKIVVKMTLEHIDDDQTYANTLKNTQQFPVVTRKFRQVPQQTSKENSTEDDPKAVLEDTAKAQIIGSPSSDKITELTGAKTIKTAKANADVCEQEIEVTVSATEDTVTK